MSVLNSTDFNFEDVDILIYDEDVGVLLFREIELLTFTHDHLKRLFFLDRETMQQHHI